jgi:hypothetical protein
MNKCAGDMPGGMPRGFSSAGGPAPNGGGAPRTEHLQSDLFGKSSRGEHHKKYSDTRYGGTRENRGKQ